MRNHEVTKVQPLLDAKGFLREPGWSRQMVQQYDRTKIQIPSWRIKEWDYYLITDGHHVCCFTISDNGYMGLESVSLIDLRNSWEHTESIITAFPMGKLKMPNTSADGNSHFENKRLKLSFYNDHGKRKIECRFKNFYQGKDFSCELELEETQPESLTIATPWQKAKHFYYNQKINCMKASGKVQFGEQTIRFLPEYSFATLDWGRGVWTYDNTWLWGNGNGKVNGKSFGFNLGYGFGDTSAATENIFYYDGQAYKLDDVVFEYEEDLMKPWRITSSDGCFEGTFEPLLDRAALSDFKLILSDQHQVFGRLNGFTVLDDGTKILFEDLNCFFEIVHNKY